MYPSPSWHSVVHTPKLQSQNVCFFSNARGCCHDVFRIVLCGPTAAGGEKQPFRFSVLHHRMPTGVNIFKINPFHRIFVTRFVLLFSFVFAIRFYYNTDGKVCLPCPPGTTGSYGFLGASPPVTTGTATVPSTSLIYGGTCIACAGGSYGNGTVVAKTANALFPNPSYFADVDVGKCAQCPAGTYSAPLPDPASTAPASTGGGGWLFTVGASACTKCPPVFNTTLPTPSTIIPSLLVSPYPNLT